MAEEHRVAVGEEQLRQAALEGVMEFECPTCGAIVLAEPDARKSVCQECDSTLKITNPYF